jgi:hypothetical protein
MRQYGFCLLLAALALLPAPGRAQSESSQSDAPQSDISLGDFARKMRDGPHTKKVYNNSNLPGDEEAKPVDRLKKLGIKAPPIATKTSVQPPTAEENNSGVMLQKVLELPRVLSSTFDQLANKSLGDPAARSKALVDQYKVAQELLPPPSPPSQ